MKGETGASVFGLSLQVPHGSLVRPRVRDQSMRFCRPDAAAAEEQHGTARNVPNPSAKRGQGNMKRSRRVSGVEFRIRAYVDKGEPVTALFKQRKGLSGIKGAGRKIGAWPGRFTRASGDKQDKQRNARPKGQGADRAARTQSIRSGA